MNTEIVCKNKVEDLVTFDSLETGDWFTSGGSRAIWIRTNTSANSAVDARDGVGGFFNRKDYVRLIKSVKLEIEV